MANLDLLVFENGRTKRRPSSAQTVDFIKVVLSGSPSGATDAATKGYVDSVATGLSLKMSCRVATTAALAVDPLGSGVGKTLTAQVDGAVTIDSVALSLNDRVLVKNQSTASDNGIYFVSQVGSGILPYILTRATDADGTPSTEVKDGMFTFIGQGTINADRGYVLISNDPITVDITAQNFTQFSSAGTFTEGNGIDFVGGTAITVEHDGEGLTFAGTALSLQLAGNTLVKDGLGLKVDTYGITSNELAADSVTTVKILNANVTTAKIATAAVTANELAADSVTTVKILNANVTADKLAADSVTTVKILDANVTADKLAADSVTTVKILDANVTLDKLASLSVDENKLTASVAGDGLTGGAGSALAVGAGTAISVALDSVSVNFTMTMKTRTGGAVAAGDVVALSHNATDDLIAVTALADKSEGTVGNTISGTLGNKTIGVIVTGGAVAANVTVVVRRGAIVTTGTWADANIGKQVYVDAAGAAALAPTYADFDAIYAVGRVYSNSEIVYDPDYVMEY